MREAARNASLSPDTVYRWRRQDEEFRKRFEVARETSFDRAEDALAVCATELVLKDPRYQTSTIFYLKNGRPKRWRDVKELHHQGGIDVHGVGDEAIARMCTALLEKWGIPDEDDDGGNGNGAVESGAAQAATERDPPPEPAGPE